MCGIMGWTSFTPDVARMFPILAVEMESRGSTSWGISNGLVTYKKMGAITSTFDINMDDYTGPQVGAIIHTRAPSSGTNRTVEAAHPHTFLKSQGEVDDNTTLFRVIAGIHNGYLSCHDTLKNKYDDRKDFCVDSQHFFKQLIEELPMDEITGSGAFAWFDTYYKVVGGAADVLDPDKITVDSTGLYIARFNNDAFHIAKLVDGTFVFASTKLALEKAARLGGVKISELLTIKESKRYKLLQHDGPSEVDELKFGKTTVQDYGGGSYVNGKYYAPGNPIYPHIHSGSSQSGSANNSGANSVVGFHNTLISLQADWHKCPMCGGENKPTPSFNPKVEAVCGDCFTLWIDPYLTAYWEEAHDSE